MAADNASEAWPEWRVMNISALGDPDARSFFVGDGDWPFNGFIVHKNGQVFAYANICPHRRHPLELEPHDFLADNGNLIRCTSHGALFCPETGVCLVGPCVGRSLVTLPCRLEPDGTICVHAPASSGDIQLPE